MCTTCGCEPHDHKLVSVEEDILAHNDRLAAANRRRLAARGVFAVNLMSSPGSGKTTLLCETIRRLAGEIEVAVIEGDQQTSRDADRIRETGARAIQVNTGRGCHLDAQMVGAALDEMNPAAGSLLMIENVGNLVCPTGYDLGEDTRVALLSVTEGEDKPLKYPQLFNSADVVVVTKTDIADAVEWNREEGLAAIRQIAPDAVILETSARTGVGVQALLDLLLDSGDAQTEPTIQLQEAT